MKYFSEAYFRNIAYSTPLYEQRTYSDNLQGASLYKQFDIFLSYNISDLNVVKGIYYTLSKMGLQVYLVFEDCSGPEIRPIGFCREHSGEVPDAFEDE